MALLAALIQELGERGGLKLFWCNDTLYLLVCIMKYQISNTQDIQQFMNNIEAFEGIL